MVTADAHPRLSPRGGVLAPFVTAWSEEIEPTAPMVVVPGRGIAYADENVSDRDRRGVLWLRCLSRPGEGRPQFGKVHPLRQRRAMLRLLCQVCGGPADRTEDGVLWLLPDHRDDWADWPNRMGVTEPPICLDCVELSVRLCPPLRRGAVAFRACRYPVAGVHGVLYSGGSDPKPMEIDTVPMTSPQVRWIQAMSLARQLGDCQLIETDELIRSRRN